MDLLYIMEKINFRLKQEREHMGAIIPAIARVVHKRMDEFSEKSLCIYIYICIYALSYLYPLYRILKHEM